MTTSSRVRRPLKSDVVRDVLRDEIVSGVLPPGTKLPNEDRLCERFDVSRITIREAIRGLVEAGIVDRRQGSGTFVAARPQLRNSLDTNFGYTDLIEAMGMRAGHRRLASGTVTADENVAELLGIEPGEQVVRLERVRTADDRPALYSIDYMPASLVDTRRDDEALDSSIYHLLAGLGHTVDHGEATIRPVLADRRLAGILNVEVGEPLQHLVQVDFDANGQRLLLSYEWHVPRIIEFRVYRRNIRSIQVEGIRHRDR